MEKKYKLKSIKNKLFNTFLDTSIPPRLHINLKLYLVQLSIFLNNNNMLFILHLIFLLVTH